MNTNWNLNILYTGLNDPSYEEDFKKLEGTCKTLADLVKSADTMSELERTEALLTAFEEQMAVMMKLMNYISLSQSVDTENGDLMAQMARLQRVFAANAEVETAASKILGRIEDIPALAAQSALVKEYEFYLEENKKGISHLLSDEVEGMIQAMDMTGGSAWGQLQSFLTSTLKVDYQGEVKTLSEIRNLAYSPDVEIRKAAYEAELASYENVADSIAFALNNIKNQTTMISTKRGYESPLAKTLEQSRLSRATLDAMIEAMKEYMPAFRKYLRAKGKLLGDPNGIRWYNIFAPVGTSDKTFSVEEAREYLLSVFGALTPDMAEMMKQAFDEEWIDFFPRKGKEGGAFCAGIQGMNCSRILTNFDGSFSAVDTLAHELGHAYHNRQLENERPLNTDYPMPVAETASTFNEVHLGKYAVSQATSREEKLNLLDSQLIENCQCIVDIYSRYLFESAVFEQSQQKFLMANDLKEIMLNAQNEAYGDGVDPEYRHPFMWACKGHYYSSGLSFYNFPYAFGNLFAEGMYALYLRDGDAFIPRYKEMLRNTPKTSCEGAGAFVGVDLTKKEFWENSLKLMAEDIDEFCRLCDSL